MEAEDCSMRKNALFVSEIMQEEFWGRWRVRDALYENSIWWFALVLWLVVLWGMKLDFSSASVITVLFVAVVVISTLLTLVANKMGAPYGTDPREFEWNLRLLDRRLAEKWAETAQETN